MTILGEPDSKGSGDNKIRRSVVVVAAIVLLGIAAGAYWTLVRSRQMETPQTSRPVVAAKPTPRPSSTPVPVHVLDGTLEIEANEEGAIVSIDGRELGMTPQRIELSPGRHRVRVEKDGFALFAREVEVASGRTVRLSARLEPGAPRLLVDADVAGAAVFLNHKPEGKTPLELRDLAPGSYRLNVTAEGYEMYGDHIELTSGTHEVMVRFKEVRLDETIDVVHKHGMGSCRGRLIATVDGLRYETSHTKDAFQVDFGDVEPLRTDYLKKNLRVKVRGGKTYNFTAESADELLSFQQAVEAARRRLYAQADVKTVDTR